jgi:transposase
VLDSLGRRLARRQQSVQVRIARELVARCRELTRQADQLKREIETLVRREAPQLLALPGCGALTAAKLVGEIAGVERFRTDAQLAMHAGVAPLDVSSGRQQRHRLNRAGNRQLNRALHTIAIVQKRVYPPAKAYIARRQADGKTNKEAIRALKRQLARRVFNILHQIAGPTNNPQRIQSSRAPAVPCLT